MQCVPSHITLQVNSRPPSECDPVISGKKTYVADRNIAQLKTHVARVSEDRETAVPI